MTVLRELATHDLPDVLALNNAHAAEVNALTATELAALVAVAVRARVVVSSSQVCGFLLVFSEGTPAQGPNHAWFREREPRFLYIDRIVIALAARGQGHARALYEDLAASSRERPLCCEVNDVNIESIAFHERLGFVACGSAVDPRNGKRVRYFKREAG